MALTFSNYQYRGGGFERSISGLVAFDNSYPKRGYSVTPAQLGLGIVDKVLFTPELSGYHFYYDSVNQKLHVQRAGRILAVEATGTFAAGAAYTMHMLPGYVLAIRGSAGSTGVKRLIPNGETLAAGQCSINYTTGVITWGDATITAAVIIYIPLGVPGFTSDLLVVDEASPIASNVITTANRAAAIQYIWNDEDNEILNYVPVGESPSGAQCAIDINNSGSTTITVTTGRIGDGSTGKTKVTYIKYSAAIHDRLLRWVDQADRTVTSDIMGPGTDQTLDVPGIIIPGYGQAIVGETTSGTTNLFSVLADVDVGTPGANVCAWNPWRSTFTFANGDAYVTTEIPLIYYPNEIAGGAMIDVPFGQDLSALSGVQFSAFGS